MTLYAFDDIDDAIDATRALLWPFDLGRWARLAVVAFFIGGVGGGFNPLQFTSGAPPGGRGFPRGAGSFPEVGARVWAIVLAVVAVTLLVGLLFLLVASVMEFVFVESLRRESVHVRRYWGGRWRQGVRLFAFRLVLGLVSLAVLGGLVLVVLLPLLTGRGEVSIALFLLAIPVFVLLAVVGGLVNGFTTVFAVPVMMVEDCGVLAAWRRFWPTMTGQWKQYLTYAVMGFVLKLAASIVAGIAMVVLAVVVAIPLAIVGLVGAWLLSVSSLAGGAVIGLAIALFVLAMLVVVAFVGVPVQTFLRYYALLVLGDTEESFDLVAERRRAIREGEA